MIKTKVCKLLFCGLLSTATITGVCSTTISTHGIIDKDIQLPEKEYKYDKFKTFNLLDTIDYVQEATKLIDETITAFRGGMAEAMHFVNQNTDIRDIKRMIEEFYVKPMLDNFNKYINMGYDADYFACMISGKGTTYYDWRNNLTNICIQANNYDNAGLLIDMVKDNIEINWNSDIHIEDLEEDDNFVIGGDITDIISNNVSVFGKPLTHNSLYDRGDDFGLTSVLDDFDSATGNINIRFFTYTSYDSLRLMLDDKQILQYGGVPFSFNILNSPEMEIKMNQEWFNNTIINLSDNAFINNFADFYSLGDTLSFDDVSEYFTFSNNDAYCIEATYVENNFETDTIGVKFNVKNISSDTLFDSDKRIYFDEEIKYFTLPFSDEEREILANELKAIEEILNTYSDSNISHLENCIKNTEIYINAQYVFFATSTAFSIAYFASAIFIPGNAVYGTICAAQAGLALWDAIAETKNKKQMEEYLSEIIFFHDSTIYKNIVEENARNIVGMMDMTYTVYELIKKSINGTKIILNSIKIISKNSISTLAKTIIDTIKEITIAQKIMGVINGLGIIIDIASICIEIWWEQVEHEI